MINLTDINEVKALQANMRVVFESPQGKEVIAFLETACGWYESVFDPVNRDLVLIKAGRREVLATIKTILKSSPEAVVALAKQREE